MSCTKKNLISPPKWLTESIHYETITGSVSYGVSSDTSDMDIVGFCIPPKEDVFPHLRGEIQGFGTQKPRFDVWQEHHVKDGIQEYDFTIYSIVKYFQLLMDNNPNILDSIFSPESSLLYYRASARLIRDNRRLFLHKGSYHRFMGYSYSQLNKIEKKKNSSNPKRKASVEQFGYDVKSAYHLVRLALECEQILLEHDLDIEKNSEILLEIRCGEWSAEKLSDWFAKKEKHLEELYSTSTLRHSPDETKIKQLLLDCLETSYGSLDGIFCGYFSNNRG